MSFYTLTPMFWCFLHGLPLPLLPLNRMFGFCDPISFKEINYLPLHIKLFLNVTRCYSIIKLTVRLKLCSNSLELQVFLKSQNVMANGNYGIETIYRRN